MRTIRTVRCELHYEVLTNKYQICGKRLSGICEQTVRSLRKRRASLCMLFVSDQKMRVYNERFFARMRTTDVIAIPWKQDSYDRALKHFLGDVIISLDRARYQAPRYNTTIAEEYAIYVIHGILHLCGYDDTVPREREKMFERQSTILNTCKDAGLISGRLIRWSAG